MSDQGSAAAGPHPVGYGHRVARTRKLFAALTRRGPHRVMRGDLAFAGLPGMVYTPASGLNLPAVAFAHDWLTVGDRYAKTLEHLASWGIVAAAPNTERGVAPSVLNLAFDLGTALDIIAGVRLGPGEISVHPDQAGRRRPRFRRLGRGVRRGGHARGGRKRRRRWRRCSRR